MFCLFQGRSDLRVQGVPAQGPGQGNSCVASSPGRSGPTDLRRAYAKKVIRQDEPLGFVLLNSIQLKAINPMGQKSIRSQPYIAKSSLIYNANFAAAA